MKWLTENVIDRLILLAVSIGLIAIIMSIVWGLFLNPRTLPNWAENVLVSVATACALKLGDCLSTIVALANGTQLALSSPNKATPHSAAEAADQVADAAIERRDDINQDIEGATL